MDNFEHVFLDLLEEVLGQEGLTSQEWSQAAAQVLDSFILEAASQILPELKRRAPRMLRRNQKLDAGFYRRNIRRWEQPLNLLELLWHISEEVGGNFSNVERPTAAAKHDYQFDALVSLHARALLVGREVLCLLCGGYPDGALSRWRSLHELAVTASFLAQHDQVIAHRYLEAFHFSALRAARQLNQHADRAGMVGFSEQELDEMIQRCAALEVRFGNEMRNEYGWAYPAINNPRPNFTDLEKAVELDHWRPRYRWASQHTHGGHRPSFSLLGMAETKEQMLLVGQSNSGFVDPIHMTAITLNIVTASLLLIRPTVDNLISVKVLSKLASEIGPIALEIERCTKMTHKGVWRWPFRFFD